uniref:Uncharacterized protein n=1 Tax=Leptospira ellisii TaxID=2023197 RepID=A0A2N0B3N7_9LEPT|nr:hypothetical protein CH379_20450 [Leptospira ellisii]
MKYLRISNISEYEDFIKFSSERRATNLKFLRLAALSCLVIFFSLDRGFFRKLIRILERSQIFWKKSRVLEE